MSQVPAASKPVTKGQMVLFAILGLLGLGVVMNALGIDGGSSDADGYGAKDACHSWVKEELKSPSTASFHNDQVIGSGPWTITGDVDAENSFGASLRSSWTCEVRLEGSNYRGNATVLG